MLQALSRIKRIEVGPRLSHKTGYDNINSMEITHPTIWYTYFPKALPAEHRTSGTLPPIFFRISSSAVLPSFNCRILTAIVKFEDDPKQRSYDEQFGLSKPQKDFDLY